jgi:hypothetical protein
VRVWNGEARGSHDDVEKRRTGGAEQRRSAVGQRVGRLTEAASWDESRWMITAGYGTRSQGQLERQAIQQPASQRTMSRAESQRKRVWDRPGRGSQAGRRAAIKARTSKEGPGGERPSQSISEAQKSGGRPNYDMAEGRRGERLGSAIFGGVEMLDETTLIDGRRRAEYG